MCRNAEQRQGDEQGRWRNGQQPAAQAPLDGESGTLQVALVRSASTQAWGNWHGIRRRRYSVIEESVCITAHEVRA
jgi:hypothetical protein